MLARRPRPAVRFPETEAAVRPLPGCRVPRGAPAPRPFLPVAAEAGPVMVQTDFSERRRPPRFCCGVLIGLALLVFPLREAAGGDDPAATAPEIEQLVMNLGDPEYAVRETASERLASLGHQAADALLTAAEVSTDLEVALRARWLAEPQPVLQPSDPPAVASLLEALERAAGADRIRIMYRLLRLDDDAGIEPLARLVRLAPTAAGSRIAAALLAGEWQPEDPYWPTIGPRIMAGLDQSRRPAAVFLRGLVTQTMAAAPPAPDDGFEACRTALDLLDRGLELGPLAVAASDSELSGASETGRIFRRCLVELLVWSGHRDDALALAEALFDPPRPAADDDPDERAAAELQWLADHGLPEAVDLVADRLEQDDVSPLLLYAAAIAHRPAAAEEAATLAARARRQVAAAAPGDRERLQVITAITLASWGGFEWAGQAYRDLLADPDTTPERRVQASILYSELLHEQGLDEAAAAVLAAMLEPAGERAEQAALLFNRDPRSLRSRMLYFSARAEPDPAASRELLEQALEAYSRDVDALIAVYQLADNTPAEQAAAVARVARAAAQLEEEIQAVPDDPSGMNEYAWLVANTEGDLDKAIGYSRSSLESSPENGSYLDTLAHCHAAVGNLKRAVRTQWLAVRQEPHSPLIRRNYERFLSRASGARSE